MLTRILSALLIFSASLCAADTPRLFFGVNVGASMMSVSPPRASDHTTVTALSELLGSTDDNQEGALLEFSSTFDNFLVISPSLGMTFPVSNMLLLEGYARLDINEKDFTVQNSGNPSDKIVSRISKEIGIGGSLMVRVSKQYAIGPTVEAVILSNESLILTSSEKKDYTMVEIGIQSTYRMHDYLTLGISCNTALDQNFTVKSTASSNDKNLNLSYKVAKAAISLRITPI
ncbi:hypothetical protein [Candidatus Synchoanobacter obligatus]|uniref:Outer membrane protein beta-barrel domain-containing protein n=1 Tax=Candidatus Synchoanobacter obligatus TaxID=2919597 RepID=A0ABT1L3U9_9GAMM|nr:hypothetical protein [Candidatus Synchoanobacter obligatus]MCP8351857.1 hypothetical protein [Candidatus Synchoanobacter obligatus]